MAVDTNPFAILTFIAAPAILTNASSVLSLSTSNRLARNIDRARVLLKELNNYAQTRDGDTSQMQLYRELLPMHERRGVLLVRAMTAFYFAIGCFAGGSLTSLLGAFLSSAGYLRLLPVFYILAIVTGGLGMCGLVFGGGMLVAETRIALATILREAAFFRTKYATAVADEAS